MFIPKVRWPIGALGRLPFLEWNTLPQALKIHLIKKLYKNFNSYNKILTIQLYFSMRIVEKKKYSDNI